jgi:putative glycosyltransferase
MRLSVVATLFRSAPYVREFLRRAGEAARRFAGDDYEIVLVNDGSPDDSLTLALELQRDDRHLRVVDLSRNFGHHQAMWTGLKHARGDWVYLLDSDLEENPEWLDLLAAKQRETAVDVVFGVQQARAGGWRSRFAASMFYRVFNALSTVPIPENLMTIRLMSRRYLDALLQHTEANFIIAGLWARTGFAQVSIALPKGRKPTTTYGPIRQLKLLVNSVTAFSEAPLFMVFYLGAGLLASSTLMAAVLIVRWLFFGRMLDGWPSLMVSIWFFGGLCVFCQGILGIYLARVFQEAKRRPVAIVRQVHESDVHELEGAANGPLRIAQ